jgi:hypothetical protein
MRVCGFGIGLPHCQGRLPYPPPPRYDKAIVDALELHYSSITVSIKGQTTDCFPFTQGVPQGSSLSGLLFIIVLSATLHQKGKIPETILQRIQRKDANFLTKIPKPLRQTEWPVMMGYSDDCNMFFKSSPGALEAIISFYEKNTQRSVLRISRVKTEIYPLNRFSLKKAEELGAEYNKNRQQEVKIKNIMTNKLKWLHQCLRQQHGLLFSKNTNACFFRLLLIYQKNSV